jgi:hypothetical protein
MGNSGARPSTDKTTRWTAATLVHGRSHCLVKKGGTSLSICLSEGEDRTMMRVFALAAAAAGLSVGCSKSGTPIDAQNDPGITIQLPGPSTIKVGRLVDARFNEPNYGIEIKDRELHINGKNYGALRPGDRVIVEGLDAVSVNGEKRTPAGG